MPLSKDSIQCTYILFLCIVRSRLHDTREIFIRTNIRAADTMSSSVCTDYSIRTIFGYHQSVQAFNLLWRCTSAGQIVVRYHVNYNQDEYLHGSVSDSVQSYATRHFNEDPTDLTEQTIEQRPKELIRAMRYVVSGEPM